MISNSLLACLTDVYKGEILGESAFDRMLIGAAGPEQKFIIGSLRQFETEGKAILRPLLMRLGLPIIEDLASRQAGSTGGLQLNDLPWIERFGDIGDTVKTQFLPRYLELATLVSAEEEPDAARVAAFMGRHERALAAVADNVVAGIPDPVAPVVALLNFPLPRPAT